MSKDALFTVAVETPADFLQIPSLIYPPHTDSNGGIFNPAMSTSLNDTSAFMTSVFVTGGIDARRQSLAATSTAPKRRGTLPGGGGAGGGGVFSGPQSYEQDLEAFPNWQEDFHQALRADAYSRWQYLEHEEHLRQLQLSPKKLPSNSISGAPLAGLLSPDGTLPALNGSLNSFTRSANPSTRPGGETEASSHVIGAFEATCIAGASLVLELLPEDRVTREEKGVFRMDDTSSFFLYKGVYYNVLSLMFPPPRANYSTVAADLFGTVENVAKLAAAEVRACRSIATRLIHCGSLAAASQAKIAGQAAPSRASAGQSVEFSIPLATLVWLQGVPVFCVAMSSCLQSDQVVSGPTADGLHVPKQHRHVQLLESLCVELGYDTAPKIPYLARIPVEPVAFAATSTDSNKHEHGLDSPLWKTPRTSEQTLIGTPSLIVVQQFLKVTPLGVNEESTRQSTPATAPKEQEVLILFNVSRLVTVQADPNVGIALPHLQIAGSLAVDASAGGAAAERRLAHAGGSLGIPPNLGGGSVLGASRRALSPPIPGASLSDASSLRGSDPQLLNNANAKNRYYYRGLGATYYCFLHPNAVRQYPVPLVHSEEEIPFRMNSDSLRWTDMGEMEPYEVQCRMATRWAVQEHIPTFVELAIQRATAHPQHTPLATFFTTFDGNTLKSWMHESGVNLRYLGQVHKHLMNALAQQGAALQVELQKAIAATSYDAQSSLLSPQKPGGGRGGPGQSTRSVGGRGNGNALPNKPRRGHDGLGGTSTRTAAGEMNSFTTSHGMLHVSSTERQQAERCRLFQTPELLSGPLCSLVEIEENVRATMEVVAVLIHRDIGSVRHRRELGGYQDSRPVIRGPLERSIAEHLLFVVRCEMIARSFRCLAREQHRVIHHATVSQLDRSLNSSVMLPRIAPPARTPVATTAGAAGAVASQSTIVRAFQATRESVFLPSRVSDQANTSSTAAVSSPTSPDRKRSMVVPKPPPTSARLLSSLKDLDVVLAERQGTFGTNADAHPARDNLIPRSFKELAVAAEVGLNSGLIASPRGPLASRGGTSPRRPLLLNSVPEDHGKPVVNQGLLSVLPLNPLVDLTVQMLNALVRRDDDPSSLSTLFWKRSLLSELWIRYGRITEVEHTDTWMLLHRAAELCGVVLSGTLLRELSTTSEEDRGAVPVCIEPLHVVSVVPRSKSTMRGEPKLEVDRNVAPSNRPIDTLPPIQVPPSSTLLPSLSSPRQSSHLVLESRRPTAVSEWDNLQPSDEGNDETPKPTSANMIGTVTTAVAVPDYVATNAAKLLVAIQKLQQKRFSQKRFREGLGDAATQEEELLLRDLCDLLHHGGLPWRPVAELAEMQLRTAILVQLYHEGARLWKNFGLDGVCYVPCSSCGALFNMTIHPVHACRERVSTQRIDKETLSVGVSDGRLPSYMITASSWLPGSEPSHARRCVRSAAWRPDGSKATHQEYLELSFGTSRLVNAVELEGDGVRFVDSVQIQYTSNMIDWVPFTGAYTWRESSNKVPQESSSKLIAAPPPRSTNNSSSTRSPTTVPGGAGSPFSSPTRRRSQMQLIMDEPAPPPPHKLQFAAPDSLVCSPAMPTEGLSDALQKEMVRHRSTFNPNASFSNRAASLRRAPAANAESSEGSLLAHGQMSMVMNHQQTTSSANVRRTLSITGDELSSTMLVELNEGEPLRAGFLRGNRNGDRVVRIEFAEPFAARGVRFVVGNEDADKAALRCEVYYLSRETPTVSAVGVAERIAVNHIAWDELVIPSTANTGSKALLSRRQLLQREIAILKEMLLIQEKIFQRPTKHFLPFEVQLEQYSSTYHQLLQQWLQLLLTWGWERASDVRLAQFSLLRYQTAEIKFLATHGDLEGAASRAARMMARIDDAVGPLGFGGVAMLVGPFMALLRDALEVAKVLPHHMDTLIHLVEWAAEVHHPLILQLVGLVIDAASSCSESCRNDVAALCERLTRDGMLYLPPEQWTTPNANLSGSYNPPSPRGVKVRMSLGKQQHSTQWKTLSTLSASVLQQVNRAIGFLSMEGTGTKEMPGIAQKQLVPRSSETLDSWEEKLTKLAAQLQVEAAPTTKKAKPQ